jgi:hypothetical protein
VLVAGGTFLDPDTCELYNSATGTWSLTGSLNTGRNDHTATLLADGIVLVTGGAFPNGTPIASAELYIKNHDSYRGRWLRHHQQPR